MWFTLYAIVTRLLLCKHMLYTFSNINHTLSRLYFVHFVVYVCQCLSMFYAILHVKITQKFDSYATSYQEVSLTFSSDEGTEDCPHFDRNN